MKSAFASRKLRSTLLAACLAAGIAWSGAALGQTSDPQPWEVSGKLIGKPKNLNGSESKPSADVSGIACATTSSFPRICLVVDDETQGVQIVILEDGRMIAGDFVRLIENSFANKPLELDAEGAAYADGLFYVSHRFAWSAAPRTGTNDAAKIEARAKASSRIFRVRFAPDSIDMKTGKLHSQPEKTSSQLPAGLIREQPELDPFADKPLEENGLTLEGVVVRDGALYVGLRVPVLADHQAAILSVPLGMLFDGKPGESSLLRLDLGLDSLSHARGIRDLVFFNDKLLILAGPEYDPAKGHPIELGDYAIFSYDQETKKLLDLKGYGSEIKPEALLPLGEIDSKLRALLLFDGPDQGQPTLSKSI